MNFIQLSRGLVIAVVLGLLFTLWVNPGTTGGLLLLLTVSTGVIYLIVSVIHLIWLGIKRSREGRKEAQIAPGDAPPFRSNRRGVDPEGEESDHLN